MAGIASTGVVSGYFGKLPVLGDFVQRQLPPGFVAPWDGWLQQGMSAARAQLGPAWAGCYARAAPWRFALEAGVCGSAPVVGAWIASHDRVGRNFPLTAAAVLPEGMGALECAGALEEWYTAVEALLAQALAGAVDAEALLHALCSQAARLDAALAREGASDPVACRELLATRGAFRLPLTAQGLTGLLAAQGAAQLVLGTPSLAAWWCPAATEPAFVATRGLPDPALFAELLRLPHAHVPDSPPAGYAAAVGAGDDAAAPRRHQFAILRGRGADAFAVAAAEVSAGAEPLAGERLGQLDQLLQSQPRPESELIERLSELLAPTTVDASRGDLLSLNLALCAPAGAGCVFGWSGSGVVFRLRGRELVRLAADADAGVTAVDAPGGGSLLDLLQEPAPDAGTPILQLSHLSQIDAGDRYLLCADGSCEALSWGQLVSVLEESSPQLAVERLREALAARPAQTAPALVLMFEDGAQGPVAHAAGTDAEGVQACC